MNISHLHYHLKCVSGNDKAWKAFGDTVLSLELHSRKRIKAKIGEDWERDMISFPSEVEVTLFSLILPFPSDRGGRQNLHVYWNLHITMDRCYESAKELPSYLFICLQPNLDEGRRRERSSRVARISTIYRMEKWIGTVQYLLSTDHLCCFTIPLSDVEKNRETFGGRSGTLPSLALSFRLPAFRFSGRISKKRTVEEKMKDGENFRS